MRKLNKVVYGSAFALAPVIRGKDTFRCSPYLYRTPQGYSSKYLEKSYDYTKDDGYSKPVGLEKGVWSEPYFDKGGGDIWIITYSIPVYTPDGSLTGVITADLEIKK
ncbi:MAG: cache domain-containing protein [Bacteroidetes bacterium]|nr:cache domain-containing protein [Bacteroidota bacterium]